VSPNTHKINTTRSRIPNGANGGYATNQPAGSLTTRGNL